MTNIDWSVSENIHFLMTMSICSRPIEQVSIDIFCLKLVYSVLDEKHIFGEITKKQCLAIGNLSTWLCILSLKKFQKTMERLKS